MQAFPNPHPALRATFSRREKEPERAAPAGWQLPDGAAGARV